MNDFTPESIAAIATRLYNEVPGSERTSRRRNRKRAIAPCRAGGDSAGGD